MKELESLQNIFKDGIFKIPDYQRGYAWSTKQLRDFWEDIINLPEHKMHYTGVLTLKRVEEDIWKNWNDEGWLIRDRGYTPYHIVDGQQRLTTVVIFIQSIIEIVKSIPENKEKSDSEIYLGTFSLKQIKETYLLISKPPQFIINTYMFSYEVDNPSFKYLRHKILNEPSGGEIGETFYTLNLENAKIFFKENVQHVLDELGIEEIEALFRKVTQNLKFNKYEIGDDFDVFVAFETMNNRGKQLSNLELLKNRLIYLTTLYDKDELKDDDRTALREKINDAWKGVYHQIGRNRKKPLNDDDFLVAHWIMYFQYSRKKGDDYINFLLGKKFTSKNVFNKVEVDISELEEYEEVREEQIEDDDDDITEEDNGTKAVSKLRPKEIEEYVSSLNSVAVHWYNTHNPLNNDDLTEEEQLWIDRLNRIGIVYFRPLVAVSFITKNITSEDRVRLFKAIERFIFITFRMGRYFSTYRNSEFYKAARQLRVGELSVDDIIKALETRMNWSFYSYEDEEKNLYFDYVHFQKYIQKKFQNGGGFYKWNGLRYLLYEYEMDKVRKRGSKKIDWNLFVKDERDKVSIEHIYPQTPTGKCWVKTFGNLKEKEKEYLTNSLGNLLPLSMSINSSLQNDCFADKKKEKINIGGAKLRMGYNDGSHSEIEVSSNDDWTPNEILERGIKILKFLEKRWNLKFESREGMLDLLFLKFLEEVKDD